MQIKHLTKINKEGSKTRAFFSIETKNFIINDVRLVEGPNGGLFAALPSREYVNKKGEKKYQPIIWIKDLDVIKAISEEAVRVYNGNAEPESDIPF